MKAITKILAIGSTIAIIITSLFILNLIYGDIFYNPHSNDPRIYKDSLGREIIVPEHPERIISMSPAITEIIYAVEADDRLVGVTRYCNYPEEAQEKPSIGGFSTPNIEIIVSLESDLVIGSRDDQELIDQLEAYNISVVMLLANSIDNILENIEDVGWLVDEEDKAEEVVDTMKNKIEVITSKTSQINKSDKLKCYFEVWETPKVVGGKSFLDDMIEKAGGKNIFGDINDEFPTVSHESVIINNPDVIFVTAMGRAYYTCTVADRDGYNVVNAVINNHIYECKDDMFTRPGPRIVDALENMTLYLYPTIFD